MAKDPAAVVSLADRIAGVFPDEAGVPAEHRRETPVEIPGPLVAGEIRAWNGPWKEVLSPVCVRAAGSLRAVPLGRYPLGGEAEALSALDAAAAAWNHGRGRWPTMPVAERIRHLEEFAFRMQERRREVVALLMWEVAKSLEDSGKEFDRTLEYLRATLEALKDLDRAGSRFAIEHGVLAQIRRAPLGVALCMGPFNYPLNETLTTLLPALAMGNTVVFKPPRLGVLLFRPLLEAMRDAFPPGVVNTVYGEGSKVIPPLLASGRVDVLAFIGSSRVADLLKKQHPKPHRMRSVLGLDAKNPAIILPDADLDLAAKECAAGSLSFNGQRCTALKILFVHESVAEGFVERLSRIVSALPFGMPWQPSVQITPVAEGAKPAYLSELVEDARTQGARVANEAGAAVNGGYFHPAVLFPVRKGTRLWTEEQFGPVVPVVPYEDLGEPIRWVIESSFGQQVSLFGRDPTALARLVDPLVNQVCRVNLNSQCQRGPDAFPFTGRKDSAEGTLSVSDALRVFSIRTLVAAKATEENKEIVRRILRERSSAFLSTDFLL